MVWNHKMKMRSISIFIVKMRVLVLEFVVLLFTWTYAGSLDYYTLEPIARVEGCHDDEPEARKQLAEFRQRKRYELRFVQRAVRV
jgi:hypothetical protein